MHKSIQSNHSKTLSNSMHRLVTLDIFNTHIDFSGGLPADVFVQDLNVVPLTSIIIHDINFPGKEGIRRKLIKTATRSDFSKQTR